MNMHTLSQYSLNRGTNLVLCGSIVKQEKNTAIQLIWLNVLLPGISFLKFHSFSITLIAGDQTWSNEMLRYFSDSKHRNRVYVILKQKCQGKACWGDRWVKSPKRIHVKVILIWMNKGIRHSNCTSLPSGAFLHSKQTSRRLLRLDMSEKRREWKSIRSDRCWNGEQSLVQFSF